MLISLFRSLAFLFKVTLCLCFLTIGACSSKKGFYHEVSDDVSPLKAAMTAEYDRVGLQDYEIDRLKPYAVKTKSGAEIFLINQKIINQEKQFCYLTQQKQGDFKNLQIYSTSHDDMEAIYCGLWALKIFRPSAYKRIIYDPKLSSPELRAEMASFRSR